MSRGNNSKIPFAIIAILIIAIAAGVTLYMMKGKDEQTMADANEDNSVTGTPAPEKKVQIYSGTDRPIAVMIDNNKSAWPQAAINDAYMVYEIIVEGGESRLMALFKNVDLEKIGPVRSSRHYFLDYVMENDAMYAHFGASYIADEQIPQLGINNINGMLEDGTTYKRDTSRNAPHNAFTSTQKILESANKKGYRTTSDQRSVLNYTTDEVLLEDGTDATYVKIPYSSFNVVEYNYNEETKMYTRTSKGTQQTDLNTGDSIATKNIIITFAENYSVESGSVLQEVKNIGKLKGYYITNGKAIEITCEKTDRRSKTVYKDLQGNEIKVNDGNTFIQICPKNAQVSFNK